MPTRSRLPSAILRRMASLFQELKRRNVFRAAAAYVVGGWLLVEIFQVLTEVFEAPGWILKLFVSLLVLGLPVVMAFFTLPASDFARVSTTECSSAALARYFSDSGSMFAFAYASPRL